MGPLDLARHPILFCGITVPEFLKWYFLDEPREIVTAYLAYFRAFNEIFSFLFLIRTLLSPWRQITDAYPRSILHFSAWSQALVLNITTRLIGAVFRITAFVVGIVMQIMLIAGFGAYLILWISFPLLFWVGLAFVLSVAA